MAELIFGKYQVIRRLAVGGMGEIFLARQSGLAGFDRLVILKSLLPDLARDQGSVNMFLDEARVAATLNHPNIVQIFEVGMWQGVYFIAMEYIEGESVARLLHACVERSAVFPVAASVRVVHDAALGLDFAHHAADSQGRILGIVHRDISPQNIMVRTDGVTRVVDFGIARAANRMTRTATGMIKGKLQYMAPEQLENLEIDARADQFALGALFWEMLTCRALFRGPNEYKTMEKLLKDPIPAPSAFVDNLPAELDGIVLRMLERDKGSRYPRCADVAAALMPIINQLGDAATPGAVGRAVKELVGELVSQRVEDLTPTGDSFLIDLRSPGEVATRFASEPPTGKHTSRVGLAIGALLLVVGLVVTFLPRDEVPVAAPPVAAQPPQAQPAPPRNAMLRLTSEPEGALVTLDGRALGRTPLAYAWPDPPALARLEVSLEGHQGQTLDIALEPGLRLDRNVILKPNPVARGRARGAKSAPKPAAAQEGARSSPGFLTVITNPWSMVFIDGKSYGSTPVYKLSLPAGRYELRLENADARIRHVERIQILPEQLTKVNRQLDKS